MDKGASGGRHREGEAGWARAAPTQPQYCCYKACVLALLLGRGHEWDVRDGARRRAHLLHAGSAGCCHLLMLLELRVEGVAGHGTARQVLVP